MCLLSLTANAQSMMRIELEDGKHVDYQVSSITSIKWFTNEIPDKSPVGAQAVDLGLSVKWANMNIGASKPEEYGDYLAWGETSGYKSGKNAFYDATYKYYKSTNGKDKDGFDVVLASGYTKYVTKSNASSDGYDGFYDDKTVLDPEDDAAVANWGGSWRMPTKDELDELITKCTWESKELNGKKGYKVTGPNGNFIFLPNAGRFNVWSIINVGESGNYFSSSLNSNRSYSSAYAYGLSFGRNWCRIDSSFRAEGYNVRAVCP